jgi:uncharacterized protein YjaZ
MTNNSASHSFSINNHALQTLLVSLQGDTIPEYVAETSRDAFEQIAPYLADDSQVLYIRDIQFLAIDGKYPGGHCYNRSEAMIAVPDWKTDKQQLVAAINHELHHMARWQNAGYGETLGGALLSEGIASYYEQLRSGWQSPWSCAEVSKENATEALGQWNNAEYDHNQWFFDGQYGKWIGYSLGTKLANRLYEAGFSLEDSLKITPDKAKSTFENVVDEILS